MSGDITIQVSVPATTYTVTAAGYQPASGSVPASSFTVTLAPVTGGQTATVHVEDSSTHSAIANASVTFGGNNYPTNAQGNAVVPAGTGTLTVSASGYTSYNPGVITIAANSTLPVQLKASGPPPPPVTGGKRLMFWVDERDIWGGGGLKWSPSQFVTNYFGTAPNPGAFLFATDCGVTYPQAASWLAGVLSLMDGMSSKPLCIVLAFNNISGGPITLPNGTVVQDQTAQVQAFFNAIKGHPSLFGAEYEREYYGYTVAIVTKWKGLIAPIRNVMDPQLASSFSSDVVLDYSTYPYYGGVVPSTLSRNSIGCGYGETGSPPGGAPNPIWTQAVIQNIIDHTPNGSNGLNNITFVGPYASRGGAGQPSTQLWNWSVLRGWIASDPYYQSNYTKG